MRVDRTCRPGQSGAWLLLAAVLGGVIALYPDLAPFWAFIATVPLVVLLLARWLPGPRSLVAAGVVLGGM